jgi:polysaccharide pyruvyl transferase WcaK-like protein
MGDDAIRLVYEINLPQLSLINLPTLREDFLRAIPKLYPRHTGRIHLLVGGGTVIGRRTFRRPLAVNLALTRLRPSFMLGCGVEDPDFQGEGSFSGNGELHRWVSILRRFDHVTVRGPRSAELLSDVGVEATMVGDPALLLRKASSAITSEEMIGVNLGFGSDLWSHDQPHVVAEVALVVRALVLDHARRIRFLVINEEDRCWTDQCVELADLPKYAYEIVTATDPENYLTAVSSCSVLIGERLHAVILAVAAEVPSVMLEYQPKCRDFMRSINEVSRSLRTDQFVAGNLLDVTLDLLDDLNAHAGRLRDTVAELREGLEIEVNRIREVTQQQQNTW